MKKNKVTSLIISDFETHDQVVVVIKTTWYCTDIQINGAGESPELDSVGHIGWLIENRIIVSTNDAGTTG